jgi:hypothetical protein
VSRMHWANQPRAVHRGEQVTMWQQEPNLEKCGTAGKATMTVWTTLSLPQSAPVSPWACLGNPKRDSQGEGQGWLGSR